MGRGRRGRRGDRSTSSRRAFFVWWSKRRRGRPSAVGDARRAARGRRRASLAPARAGEARRRDLGGARRGGADRAGRGGRRDAASTGSCSTSSRRRNACRRAVTLRLTLEYDGTRVPRLGAPAGRSGRSRARCARRSTRVYPAAGTGSPSPGAPTPASTRPGRSRASPVRAARRSRASPRRSTPRCPTTSPCSRPRRRRTASTRDSRRRAARTATSSSTASSRSPLARVAVALVAAAARRSTASRRAPRRSSGEHDFTAFTPTETQHEVFVRDRPRGGVGAARRRAPLHDHRRLVPPAHGADARRHDARAGRRGGSHGCSRAGRARRPARPRRRGGSTSSACEYDVSPATADGRDPGGCPATIDGVRYPRRPLRPRRHADRLRADHPRLDAARVADRARPGAGRGARPRRDRRPGPDRADARPRSGPRRRARRGLPRPQRAAPRDARGVRRGPRAAARAPRRGRTARDRDGEARRRRSSSRSTGSRCCAS